MSSRDERYLLKAFEAAHASTARSQRHGAVVVKNGNVLAIGVNRDKNHPSTMHEWHIKKGACVHAEVDAVRQVSNLIGATVYVARVSRNGTPAFSRPCDNCETHLRALGVKRVIHT